MAPVRPVGGAGQPAPLSGASLRQILNPRSARGAQAQAELSRMFSPGTEAMQSPVSGIPVSSSKGEFNEVISVYNDEATLSYYDPKSRQYTSARNLAGTPTFYEDDQGNLYDYETERVPNRPYYDLDDETGEWVAPGQKGPQYGEDTRPAPLSVVPTSTTNPARPRTVAAGYDKYRQVITVVFRDGTWYNYYECDPATWQAFKSRVSKGQYIYKYLDFHARGPANVNDFSDDARQMMYRVVRTTQIHLQGKQIYRGSKGTTTTKPATSQKKPSKPSRKK